MEETGVEEDCGIRRMIGVPLEDAEEVEALRSF